MSTSLLSKQALSNPDWIDLYLSEPTGAHISNFPETINHVLRSAPTMSTGWSSEQLNKKFLTLLSQFGRFWIKMSSTDCVDRSSTNQESVNELFYRTSSGIDVRVNDLSMHYSHRALIVRINGMVIPTICLAQLTILLQKYGHNSHQDTLRSIHRHWPQIEDSIERQRIIFNSIPNP